MRVSLLVLCFVMSMTAMSQKRFGNFLSYDYRPHPDFYQYIDIPITWNFDGQFQVMLNAGITELKEEKYFKALQNLEGAVKHSPNVWVAHYYKGIANKMLGNLQQATLDLTMANVESGGRYEAYVELGEIFQSQRHYDEALSQFDAAIELSPDKVAGYFGIANISFLKYEYDRASRFYKKCIDINPKFPNAYLQLGLLKLVVNAREKKALSYFDQALEADSTFKQGLFWRGLVSMEFDDLEQAIDDWSRLIRYHPEIPFFNMTRGFLMIEKGDYERAFTDFKNALLKSNVEETDYRIFGSVSVNYKIDLHNASQYLMRNIYGFENSVSIPMKKGFCFIIAERYQDAILAFEESLKVQPTASAFLLKALAHEYAQEHELALLNYEHVLRIDDDIFDAHKKRAIYRTAQKDYRGAALDFLAMERLQPESIVTFKLRGLLKNNLKEFYGAIVDLTSYLKVDSLDAEVIEGRAHALVQVKNYKLAQADYKKLIRLYPRAHQFYELYYAATFAQADTVGAWKVLDEYERLFPHYPFGFLQKMELHILEKDWTSALLVFEKFLTEFKSNSSFHSKALYLKGIVLLNQNKKTEALDFFSESIQMGNAVRYKNLDALFHRGKIYWESGKKKKAMDDFTILVESGYTLNADFVSMVMSSK